MAGFWRARSSGWRAPGTTAMRAMYVSEDIWALLSTTHDDEELEDRLGMLQADLELFAEGQSVDPKDLFLLSPVRDSVWESPYNARH